MAQNMYYVNKSRQEGILHYVGAPFLGEGGVVTKKASFGGGV